MRGDEQTATETSGADVLTSRQKKLKKTIPVLKMTNTAKSTQLHLLHGRKKLQPPRRFIHLINDNIYHYNALRVFTEGKCQQSSVTSKC